MMLSPQDHSFLFNAAEIGSKAAILAMEHEASEILYFTRPALRHSQMSAISRSGAFAWRYGEWCGQLVQAAINGLAKLQQRVRRACIQHRLLDKLPNPSRSIRSRSGEYAGKKSNSMPRTAARSCTSRQRG